MTDDIKDDLAYVKALAEEGRDTPLVGGVLYLIWGGLIGTAALFVYADAIGWISLGPLAGVWPWILAIGAGWGLCFFLAPKAHSKPGGVTLGNKTARSVWFAVGIFVTSFWITLMFVHDDFTEFGVPAYFLFSLMFPISFGLFGVAFFATATAARIDWLRWIAVLSWVFALTSLAFMASDHQMLIGALGSYLCAAVPGALLMRNEPSEIV